jgi:hypothetical protein
MPSVGQLYGSEEDGLATMMQQAVEDFGFYEIATQAGRDEIVEDSKGVLLSKWT